MLHLFAVSPPFNFPENHYLCHGNVCYALPEQTMNKVKSQTDKVTRAFPRHCHCPFLFISPPLPTHNWNTYSKNDLHVAWSEDKCILLYHFFIYKKLMGLGLHGLWGIRLQWSLISSGKQIWRVFLESDFGLLSLSSVSLLLCLLGDQGPETQTVFTLIR